MATGGKGGAEFNEQAANIQSLYGELLGLLATPIPAPAASGALVMPSPGGSLMQVAEAGQPEVIFPLDKLESFINKGTLTGSSSGTPIQLNISLDSKTLYSGIFQATKNKTVLISASSVV